MLRVKKIASGYGQFDTITSELTASMTFLSSGKFDKLLIIIKSRNDCIAPFVFYNKTLIQGAPENISYNIRAYLHWRSTEMDSLTIPLYKYSNVHITIIAQHAPDNLGFQSHAAGMSGQLIKRAVLTKLGSSVHRGVRASIFAGYATKINSSQVRDFYLRPEKDVYKLIACSTFMQSLQIALAKFDIDIADYQPMLKSIDSFTSPSNSHPPWLSAGRGRTQRCGACRW